MYIERGETSSQRGEAAQMAAVGALDADSRQRDTSDRFASRPTADVDMLIVITERARPRLVSVKPRACVSTGCFDALPGDAVMVCVLDVSLFVRD